jgi:hypothetical protein
VPIPVALFRQRGDSEEVQEYRAMQDAMTVFRRHTQEAPLGRRLALQPVLWQHRGWYAATFTCYARTHASRHDSARALRSLRFALVASPAHALLRQPDFWRTVAKIARRGRHSTIRCS